MRIGVLMSDTKVMMDPEIKAEWVAALRSGDFIQVRGTLRSKSVPNGRCCLGVLCDVLDKRNGTDDWNPGITGGEWTWGPSNNWSMPPDYICEKIGLPISDDGRDVSTLQIKNDGEQADFFQIADFIEANL